MALPAAKSYLTSPEVVESQRYFLSEIKETGLASPLSVSSCLKISALRFSSHKPLRLLATYRTLLVLGLNASPSTSSESKTSGYDGTANFRAVKSSEDTSQQIICLQYNAANNWSFLSIAMRKNISELYSGSDKETLDSL